MKTQTQAKKTNSTISQKSQTLEKGSIGQSLSNSKRAESKPDNEATFHAPRFNLSNLSTNPSSPKTTGGNPMPKVVQQKMEVAFDTDFSDVRIHEGKEAESIGANAYTQGTNIHFAQGKYEPNNFLGQSLLGHELSHVVQQRLGRVSRPINHLINQNLALETEAENQGIRAAQGKPVNSFVSTISKHTNSTTSPQVIQCARTSKRLREKKDAEDEKSFQEAKRDRREKAKRRPKGLFPFARKGLLGGKHVEFIGTTVNLSTFKLKTSMEKEFVRILARNAKRHLIRGGGKLKIRQVGGTPLEKQANLYRKHVRKDAAFTKAQQGTTLKLVAAHPVDTVLGGDPYPVDKHGNPVILPAPARSNTVIATMASIPGGEIRKITVDDEDPDSDTGEWAGNS